MPRLTTALNNLVDSVGSVGQAINNSEVVTNYKSKRDEEKEYSENIRVGMEYAYEQLEKIGAQIRKGEPVTGCPLAASCAACDITRKALEATEL